MRLTAFECTTDFPDDQVDDGEEIIIPGGRGVAEAVADLLRTAGMEASQPEINEEYGWDFFASLGRTKYWMIVTDLGDLQIVQAQDVSPLMDRILKGKSEYRNFVDALQGMLADNNRFKSVSRLPRR